eukprot:scaffold8833_cov58-Phaeocystis_antarctica.AAC.9
MGARRSSATLISGTSRQGREAVVLAGIHGRGAKLLLDAQQLVVLGETLRAAGRARLDLGGGRGGGEYMSAWCAST